MLLVDWSLDKDKPLVDCRQVLVFMRSLHKLPKETCVARINLDESSCYDPSFPLLSPYGCPYLLLPILSHPSHHPHDTHWVHPLLPSYCYHC
jgi:hypothetical protein